jgi:hypothetical protein
LPGGEEYIRNAQTAVGNYIAQAGPGATATVIGRAQLRDVYFQFEQRFNNPALADPTTSARQDAARIVKLASKRVLFAEIDHEIWQYVFKALHKIRRELETVMGNLVVSEPNISNIVRMMTHAIAIYLSVHETDYLRFMSQPSKLSVPHRERNWPGLGETAQDLLSLRHLLNNAICNLNVFAADGTITKWEPLRGDMAEHWLEYSKRWELCEICGRNLGFMPKKFCARCSERNVGFYLQINKLGLWSSHAYSSRAYVTGSFNNWKQDEFRIENFSREYDEFLGIRLSLPEGKHLYKFIVDGKWLLDPHNKLTEADEHGNLNSVVVIFPLSGRSWLNRTKGPEIVF